jgi:hypothetical protein
MRLTTPLVMLTAFIAMWVFITPVLASGACSNEALREEQGSTFLPDCRAYELASPADKGGGDVMPNSSRTRAAADGGAVNFTSLVALGDAHGATIGTEYIAERTGAAGTSGWTTHGITPAQQPFPLYGAFFGFDPSYDGEFSSDLSRGVFRAYRPITDAPDVAGQLNLYVRRDLRTPGAGFYQLISDPGFAVPTPPSPVRPYLAGASSDFSHVIFESSQNLDADASGSDPKLYEWANGTLRLAGVLPDGTAATSSQAGRGATSNSLPRSTPRMISTDGSRIFFQAPVSTGNVYMRVNGTTTVQLNASEKTAPEAPQGATLWTASADGTRIFFSTTEGLVDGDDDGAEDYYMYDVSAPAGHHLTLISRDGEPSVNDSGLGVVGASDDGHYLYFMMSGQLVAGEPPLVSGLYVWHDGTVRFIGDFAQQADTDRNQLEASWILVGTTLMARVSADGSHVLFAATDDSEFRGHGGLGGFDHGTACGGGCREFYVYSAASGQLRCASCDPSGTPPIDSAQDNTRVDAYVSAVAGTSYINHALSSDGRWTFFNSPDALVPEDVNGRVDAYEYDSQTDRISLLSSGRSTDDSYFLDASASGRDAFFVTRERLVGWDVDGNYDLYDARVGGGLPEPVAPPPACAGDACQGTANLTSSFRTPSSVGFTGSGNLKPVISTKSSKSLTRSQKLRKALKACKSKHGKAKRKKCERTTRKRISRSGGSR